jgi:predicted nuclease with TOPRIM domain
MSAGLDTIEDLESALEELREDVDRIDKLEELLETNLTGVFTRISEFDDRLETIEDRLNDLEGDVKRASATSSKNKQGKIQKGIDVLEFGAKKKTHGVKGVAITTGEVLAAASCSRSRAQSLMDEIAVALDEATTESSSGPKAKQLRISFQDQDVECLIDELLEEWGETGE